MQAQRTPLDEGRWHGQHGPIDVIVSADGEAAAVAAAHEAAWRRFQSVLGELVAELPWLRAPLCERCPLEGVIARRMWAACAACANGAFMTPMAAVAGAVADELIACYRQPGIERAWVNNGGDIALHLAPGAALRVGLFADLARLDAQEITLALTQPLRTDAQRCITAAQAVRGVATSGWRGRSFSLGIADSVTVLADSAAAADAAATMIANAVDVQDTRILRRPANTLKDDTDLGTRLVTVRVPTLEAALIRRALQAGRQRACELQAAGLIDSAVLVCQGGWASTDDATPRVLNTVAASAVIGTAADVGSVFA